MGADAQPQKGIAVPDANTKCSDLFQRPQLPELFPCNKSQLIEAVVCALWGGGLCGVDSWARLACSWQGLPRPSRPFPACKCQRTRLRRSSHPDAGLPFPLAGRFIDPSAVKQFAVEQISILDRIHGKPSADMDGYKMARCAFFSETVVGCSAWHDRKSQVKRIRHEVPRRDPRLCPRRLGQRPHRRRP